MAGLGGGGLTRLGGVTRLVAVATISSVDSRTVSEVDR